MNTIFSADADHVLDELEKDTKSESLLNAIWDVIGLVTEHPSTAPARRRVLRTPEGHSVWLVPIPVRHGEERWVLLWQPRGDNILIAYIGPDDFRSAYA